MKQRAFPPSKRTPAKGAARPPRRAPAEADGDEAPAELTPQAPGLHRGVIPGREHGAPTRRTPLHQGAF